MPNQQRSFGQPDPRTDTDRLEDLRKIQRQVTSILSARDDAAFEEQFFTDVRERRAGRTDRTQFELIPDNTEVPLWRRSPVAGTQNVVGQASCSSMWMICRMCAGCSASTGCGRNRSPSWTGGWFGCAVGS